MVIFGTPAELIFDINLIIQFVLLALIIVGVFQKRQWKYHGTIMTIATFSTLITALSIMIPSLVINWGAIVAAPTSPGALITLVHATFGSLAILVGLFFSFRFLYKAFSKQPLICGNRTQMRIVITLWLLGFVFGLAFYLYYYVFQLHLIA